MGNNSKQYRVNYSLGDLTLPYDWIGICREVVIMGQLCELPAEAAPAFSLSDLSVGRSF